MSQSLTATGISPEIEPLGSLGKVSQLVRAYRKSRTLNAMCRGIPRFRRRIRPQLLHIVRQLVCKDFEDLALQGGIFTCKAGQIVAIDRFRGTRHEALKLDLSFLESWAELSRSRSISVSATRRRSSPARRIVLPGSRPQRPRLMPLSTTSR